MLSASLEEVQVILLQGDWELLSPEVWKSEAIQMVLKAPKAHTGNQGRRGKQNRQKRRRLNATGKLPSSWKTGFVQLEHQALGGVTNGEFKFEWACPPHVPPPEFSYPPGINVTLSDNFGQKDERDGNIRSK